MPESPDPAYWLRHAVALVAVDNVNSGADGPFGVVIVRDGELLRKVLTASSRSAMQRCTPKSVPLKRGS